MQNPLKSLCLLATLAPTMSSSADVLDRFRWDYRVLVVFAAEDQLGNIRAKLDAVEAGILDRSMRWFLVDGARVITNYDGALESGFSDDLTRQLRINKQDDCEVVLVGKDGGVKYRSEKLEPDSIFRTVDSMPMRQAEMYQKPG